MPTPFFAEIDWTRPWYASVRAVAEKLTGHDDWLGALNAQSNALCADDGDKLAPTFVEQAALPAGTAYESFIRTSGKVPTRDNAHDIFNALVWLSFPRTKRALNALQAAQIERTGVGSTRGAARDAATIFDENAALLVMADTAESHAMVEALRAHQWQLVLMAQRESFARHAEVLVFGHALMEKLMRPYKGITAHAWVVFAAQEYFSWPDDVRRQWIDSQLAHELAIRAAAQFNTACFTPLPVLGVPGWWPGQDADFYGDESVFRPRRRDANLR